MRLFLFTIIYCFCYTPLSAQPDTPTIPAKIKSFITLGYEALDLKEKDLNGDGLKDYLLVLKIIGEDTITFDNPAWDQPRPLLLITGQPGGKYKVFATNKEAVYCRSCGGAMGDPYEGITIIQPGEFTIGHYGGSSWRWMDAISFRYDKVKKNWFLQTHTTTSFQAGDPEVTAKKAVITRSETGDITFAAYSPYYNTDSSYWSVIVPKTFFYDSPDLKSKPRKGYLLQNNIAKGVKTFKNFVEVSYENDKGDLTYGYILRKHLKTVPAPKQPD